MSIAQEIQRIQSAKANIKSAIEQKGITVGDGTIDTYAEKIGEISGGGSGDYEQGFEDGKNSVADVVPYLKQAQFTSLNIFKESNVTLDFNSWTSSLLNLFNVSAAENKNTIVEQLTINMPNNLPKSLQQMLYISTIAADDYKLKRVTLNFDTSASGNFNFAFTGCRALEIVDGKPLDFSSNTNALNVFQRCYNLVEFRVKANTINKNFSIQQSELLSTDTVQSIIDGLADLSGGEQYVIVHTQNGPDTYAYPEEEVIIPTEEIVNVELNNNFTMDDGAPVYTVVYHESLVSVFAYKKVTGGGTAQTLTLHATVGNKLTDTQKATITAKNWTLVY